MAKFRIEQGFRLLRHWRSSCRIGFTPNGGLSSYSKVIIIGYESYVPERQVREYLCPKCFHLLPSVSWRAHPAITSLVEFPPNL
jgi:hypothetical protein